MLGYIRECEGTAAEVNMQATAVNIGGKSGPAQAVTCQVVIWCCAALLVPHVKSATCRVCVVKQ